ncbi:hypothetical protein CsatB_009335 [Cannabis sativa]
MEDNRPGRVHYHILLGPAGVFESIWKERNSLVHGRNSTPLAVILTHINRRLDELAKVHQPAGSIQPNWLPPTAGWLMCNTDVAVGESHTAGAAVFKNEDGAIIKIYTFRIGYHDPLAGEIVARYGAKMASKLDYKNVIQRMRCSQ